MAFTARVEAHHKLAYSNNVKLVIQQLGARFRNTVTTMPCSGEAHDAAELIGQVDAIEGDGARSRSNIENVPDSERRWLIRPNAVESGQYIDKEDVFDSINYPTSKIVRAHTLAVSRVIDDRILGVQKMPDGSYGLRDGGVLGGATAGKRPGARVQLAAEYRTPAGGEGLTLDKLIAAIERLGLDDNDMSLTLSMAITPRQHTDLLKIAAQTQENLNAFQQEELKRGRVTHLMGIDFYQTNRLPKTGAVRHCPIWTRENVVLGVWQDIQGDMWNDTHAKNRPYAYVDAFVDCVRVEDKGVHVIECTES
jgi:hypothetical protein